METRGKARGSRPSVSPRADLQDQFWRDLRAMVEEIVDERAPTMGTVVGRDSSRGKLRMRLDDEDEDRSVGIPRAKGVRWNSGDRAWVARNKTGEHLAIAPVTGGDGEFSEVAVGNEHLYTDSVDGRTLKSAAVGPGHVQNGAIETGHISPNAITRGKILNSEVIREHIEIGAVNRGRIEYNAVGINELDYRSVVWDHLHSSLIGWMDGRFATKGHNHNTVYAYKNHVH